MKQKNWSAKDILEVPTMLCCTSCVVVQDEEKEALWSPVH
jgi:hypothetical protein